ncbi:MAG: hypothetical protein HQ567_02380 [Candidatus Nealsonbacteria bacterium]|nr:hypothetical protein [Candidatus Nealsonbacteria bacterium]
MANEEETKQQRLTRLQQQLADTHAKLPEHCHGTDGYITDHRATPAQWQEIENLEEEIEALKAELAPRQA